MSQAFPITSVVCWCGCGEMTKSRFKQGHDSKFHSRIKSTMRGEDGFDREAQLAALPHDEARAEWVAFETKQQPKEDERNRKLAVKAAEKAKAAADKAQAKADAAKKAAEGTTEAAPPEGGSAE